MAIEVPDTRGSGEPVPRRRTAARRAGQEQPAPEAAPSGGGGFAQRRPVRRRIAAPAVPDVVADAPPVVADAPPVVADVAPDVVPATPAPPATSDIDGSLDPQPSDASAALPETATATPAPTATPVAASAAPPVAVEDDEQLTVVVRLGGTRYAVEMAAVAEVGRPPRLTRVPGVPAWVAGLANWRGRVLAVLDIRSLLGASTGPLPARGRVVVLSRDGVPLGILAEHVEGVLAVDRSRLEAVLPTLGAPAAALVTGQLTDPRGPVAVLDVDAVFALGAQLPRVRRAG